MVCTHLKELYQLCESNQIRISSTELIQITCHKCDKVETCPSIMMDEYDAQAERNIEEEARQQVSGKMLN